ncbi:unnamed protein product, partial [Staurois parvus]
SCTGVPAPPLQSCTGVPAPPLPVLHRCTGSSPSVLHRCTGSSPSVLHRCTGSSPSVLHRCTGSSPSVLHRCTGSSPSVLRRCTGSSPGLQWLALISLHTVSFLQCELEAAASQTEPVFLPIWLSWSATFNLWISGLPIVEAQNHMWALPTVVCKQIHAA